MISMYKAQRFLQSTWTQETDVTTNAASDQITIIICEPTSDTDPDSNSR